ncbi:MAG: polysaccharide deacetylase family protein, partial [Spirochaetaceae bacterium]|nr:polysaccharide deacetylase family protein [Spirochaetaceae bacterium]
QSEEAALSNGFFRVFTGMGSNRNFDNALYVRSLTGALETRALFGAPVTKTRDKGRVSLVIDALDDASGMDIILRTLALYNLRVTFFVNGEFVRRYPRELTEILRAGHNCASMFFTPVDLSAGGFVITPEFIKRGLARNEDEFYFATNRELNPLWHTPGYVSTPEIIKAGNEAGYRWVKGDIIPPDRVTLEQSISRKIPYLSASAMIENITASLQGGAVIPVAAGVSGGRRTDYLYEKLDVLISAILDGGYEIGPLE